MFGQFKQANAMDWIEIFKGMGHDPVVFLE